MQHLETVIGWQRKEWGEDWASYAHKAIQRDTVPTIFVALINGQPVGCSMLIEYDMMTRKDLSPWMGGVYVTPEYRQQGIGSALVLHAMEVAAQIGIKRLWLYTATARHLYARLGWADVEEAFYDNTTVVIMDYCQN